ncbi:MAG: metallophosphoesterase family protein [Verrucomicrobiales bacterium]|nr:metallophosphoesterase family protein [Verrucomicrobiales bacterium]
MKTLLIIASLLLWSSSFAGIVRGPYLQMAGENQITIVWRTADREKDPSVKILKDGAVDETAKVEIETKRIEQPEEKRVYQYEAVVTGLAQLTDYEYAIYHDGKLVPSPIPDGVNRFRTYPVKGTPDTKSRIWVVGDSGTGTHAQLLVHEAMKRHVKNDQRALDLYLHVGDMAYTHGTDEQFQNRFFKPYEDTLCHTVCWAAMGNHEGKTSDGEKGVGPFYDAYVCPVGAEVGGVASGKESYYSFDYGDIHFIALNSYDVDRTPQGAMAKWLVKNLKENDSQWLIAFWHHPPYTKGSHDSDTEIELIEMREYIMPILETAGVDLVLSGHSHIYERSMLIDGAYATPTSNQGVIFDDSRGDKTPYRKPESLEPNKGTLAIVTGHGGALGRTAKGVMPVMRSIVLDHGSLILDIDGDTLSGYMIDSMARVKDRFSMVKSGTTSPVRLEKPWTPDASTIEYGPSRAPVPLPPQKYQTIIPKHAKWEYLADGKTPGDKSWTTVEFKENWPKGSAGFGYGDKDDRTELDMKGKYSSVYIRNEFTLPKDVDPAKLYLAVNYDDGFILYVNGEQILTRSCAIDPDTRKIRVESHEAKGYEFVKLAKHHKAFRKGESNVIAIEGHNVKKSSSDFSLDPYLILEQ